MAVASGGTATNPITDGGALPLLSPKQTSASVKHFGSMQPGPPGLRVQVCTLAPQWSARQHEVGRQFRWDRLRHPVAKAWQVNACEQRFTTAQKNGRYRQVQLVYRSCEQVLADRRNSAS